ncbi:MAG: membrane protein insertion efficiency factor YidD [bacterium]|nr:membrane protein insertion efficiency factor YidD [bacterium]
MTAVLIWSIRLYQVALSPLWPARCRFDPTCSDYALEAIGRYGPAKGLWRALLRIGRCHPFGGSGFDPVE